MEDATDHGAVDEGGTFVAVAELATSAVPFHSGVACAVGSCKTVVVLAVAGDGSARDRNFPGN